MPVSSNEDDHIKPLAISLGEPAGIGPDLLIQLAQEGFNIPIIAIASSELLKQRAKELDLKITLHEWKGERISRSARQELYVKNVTTPAISLAGKLNTDNASYVLSCLDFAIDGCLNKQFSGLVTGPIQKSVINDANIRPYGQIFSGHTEHLQRRCSVNKVVMMLASPRMKVALATTHIPLKDVASSIRPDSLKQVIEILISDLQTKFGISHPKILVAGLNPHAGESGHMGTEEIDIVTPVLASFDKHEVELIGPLPADTLFNKTYLDNADAVLAMFHDQGLPVLKFDGFGESVNITLGLPIIRTSVDHGTALDLAGSGQADSGSLKAAIELAYQMANSSSLVSSSHSSTTLQVN